MAAEQVLPFSVASMVEDVLQKTGTRSSDMGLASRKAEESCMIIHFLNSISNLFFFFFYNN